MSSEMSLARYDFWAILLGLTLLWLIMQSLTLAGAYVVGYLFVMCLVPQFGVRRLLNMFIYPIGVAVLAWKNLSKDTD